ncbi:hypothetical protein ACLIBH_10920 [Virgibacillus sp. W0430]|uniref:hypothetical protein n=1 Tax=Virgibacillus sp. W0430 TaxID=3391580 RepID=UPI003F46AD4D
MKHQIAVFGPIFFMDRLQKISKQINFRHSIIPFVYKNPKEVVGFIEKASSAHVLLFSGPLPHLYVKDALQKTSQPVEIVEYNENNLVYTLLHIKQTYNIAFKEISLDIIDDETVQRVSDELGFPLKINFIKDINPLINGDTGFNLDTIYQFHYDLWKKGKIKLAVTSIHLVRDRLVEAGVPTIRLIDPDNNIIEALKLSQQAAELYIRKASQVAVGIVSIEKGQHVVDDTALHEKVYQFLVKACRNANGSVRKINASNFVIHGTSGSIRLLTEGYQRCSLREGVRDALQVDLAVGFGIGSSFNEAEKHGKLAHKYALDRNQGTVVINENKELLGPIGNSRHFIQLKSNNEAIIPLAESMNIPMATLANLKAFNDSLSGKAFSSHDLAAYLQVSRRSSERLLKKLSEARRLKIIGSERPYTQGRPRSLYQLEQDFLDQL